MSITVQQLIVGSFLDGNLCAAGETPISDELDDALLRLNQLRETLNVDPSVSWENRRDTKALTSGAGSFTMGPTGDLVVDRPTRLIAARCYTTGYGRGLRVITDPHDWTSIVERDAALTLPLKLYVDYGLEVVTLHFWPVPSVAAVLTINTREIFATMALDTPPALQATAAQPTLYRKTKTFNLTSGTGFYTMGPTGTLNTSRPAEVISARVGFGAYGHDVEIIGAAEWASIIEAESAGVVLPIIAYPQFTYPNAIINFWPVPGASVTAELYTPRQIPVFALLSSTVDLPPAILRMLRTSLAVDLYPQYRRSSGIPGELMANAASAKQAVVDANIMSGVFKPPMQAAATAPQQ